jgi:hypothetical protein
MMTPHRQHADEQQADARVAGQPAGATQRGHAEHHRQGARSRADHQVLTRDRGQRHPGQHPVRHRVAQERHAPQHDPGPDQRADDGDEHARHQRASHEHHLEGDEQPVEHAGTIHRNDNHYRLV